MSQPTNPPTVNETSEKACMDNPFKNLTATNAGAAGLSLEDDTTPFEEDGSPLEESDIKYAVLVLLSGHRQTKVSKVKKRFLTTYHGARVEDEGPRVEAQSSGGAREVRLIT